MAEYYGIYNYRDFKPLYIATLMIGLSADSRLKTEISGSKIPLSTMLNALIADRLGLIFWAQTEDGQKNRNRPASIVESLTKEKSRVQKFKTHADFKEAWKRATGETDA